MNRDQLRAMQLAGTVAVPQKFPELGNLSFTNCPTGGVEAVVRREYLCVEHIINPKLRIRRWFQTRQLRAVFLPQNPACVNWSQGDWFLGGEVFTALPTALTNRGLCAQGIVYVPEQVETLMQVEVGMTAAESVEYYPPLPDDRTVDHYRMHNQSLVQQAGPANWDPCSLHSADPCSLQGKDPCSLYPGDPCSLQSQEPFSSRGWDPGLRSAQGPTSVRSWDPCSLHAQQVTLPPDVAAAERPSPAPASWRMW